MRHNEFFDVFFNKKVVRHNRKRIQSKHPRLGTYDVYKRYLSCFVDKLYVLDNGDDTFAYFHKDICIDYLLFNVVYCLLSVFMRFIVFSVFIVFECVY